MPDQQQPRRVPGWRRVLDAFVNADNRTLTNAQLGAIRGVQAFHQRRSDLVKRGFVFSDAVAIADGYYAYRLLGYRADSQAADDLTHNEPHALALPNALAACRDDDAVDKLKREGTATLRRNAPNLRDKVNAPPPAPDAGLRSENERLRARVAELEADVQHKQSEIDYLATGEEQPTTPAATTPHEGALYVVTDSLPGPEKGSAAFVELEDAEGRGYGPDIGIGWSDHPTAGLHRLGPFYAAPQAAADAIAPRRHPRAGRASGPALMRQALEALDGPAHTKVIAEHVLTHGGAEVYKGKTPQATMGAQLATSNKDGGEFVKVAPGCFGLREWDADTLAKEPRR